MFCLQSNNASLLDVGRRQLTCSGMNENKGAEGRQVTMEPPGQVALAPEEEGGQPSPLTPSWVPSQPQPSLVMDQVLCSTPTLNTCLPTPPSAGPLI